jgi:hypothetical protein
MTIGPLLLLSLPRTLVLIEVVLAVIALGMMVYLTIGQRTRDQQRTVIRVAMVLVVLIFLLSGLQFLL